MASGCARPVAEGGGRSASGPGLGLMGALEGPAGVSAGGGDSTGFLRRGDTSPSSAVGGVGPSPVRHPCPLFGAAEPVGWRGSWGRWRRMRSGRPLNGSKPCGVRWNTRDSSSRRGLITGIRTSATRCSVMTCFYEVSDLPARPGPGITFLIIGARCCLPPVADYRRPDDAVSEWSRRSGPRSHPPLQRNESRSARGPGARDRVGGPAEPVRPNGRAAGRRSERSFLLSWAGRR